MIPKNEGKNMTFTLSLPEKKITAITVTLLGILPIIGMAVDLIAPSLPGISKSLQVSDALAKSVISIYLIGYGLGNFITGFLTDAFGRQKLIRIGLFAFVLSSILPALWPTITTVLLVRFLQGLTIGGVAVVIRSVFSDILPPEKLTRLGTLIGAMWGIGPVIGPFIGGYLQFYFGWKAGFIFFGAIALISFIAVWKIVPETHLNQHPLNIGRMKKNLLEVLSHRFFMGLACLMGLTYSLIIAFNTAGPFLIQIQFHYSSIFFGHLAFCLGIIFLSSTFVCRFFLTRSEVKQLLFVVIHSFLGMALIAVIASYFLSQNIGLVTITSGLMFFATGFIFPMSMGKGMSLFRHIAGTATATMYLINMLITSLVSFLIGFIQVQNAIYMMWIYFLLMLMSALIYWLVFHREER